MSGANPSSYQVLVEGLGAYVVCEEAELHANPAFSDTVSLTPQSGNLSQGPRCPRNSRLLISEGKERFPVPNVPDRAAPPE